MASTTTKWKKKLTNKQKNSTHPEEGGKREIQRKKLKILNT